MQGSFLLEAIICQFLSKETLIESQVQQLALFYQINHHLQGNYKKLNLEDKLEIQEFQDPTSSIYQNYHEWPYNKMINISKEPDLTKQESHDTAGKTTSWSRLKDPRIVRVSRAFGGKDRHSKVSTVKGLRDRRVRLSVPTAIQLYDLQDRLGLNQPSKVVDWLLHAAKSEIDELPPLQFPPGTFPIIDPKHGLKIGAGISWNEPLEGKCKDVVSQEDQDCNWGNQDSSSYESSMPYNSFARWDPSNLSLSHEPSRSHGLLPHQHGGDWPNFNLMAPSGSHHQALVYHQHGMSGSTQSYFPNSGIGEMEGKQLNYNNNNNNESSTTSPTQPVRQLVHFNMMTANLLPSQNDDAS